MTELLVATRKGLFALAGKAGGPFEIVDRGDRCEALDDAAQADDKIVGHQSP